MKPVSFISNHQDSSWYFFETPKRILISCVRSYVPFYVKFCAVVGEIAADLIQSGTTKHDISLFSFQARRDKFVS